MLRSDERLFFGFGAELRAALLDARRVRERAARAARGRRVCEGRTKRGRRAESEKLAGEHEAQCNRAARSLAKRILKLLDFYRGQINIRIAYIRRNHSDRQVPS